MGSISREAKAALRRELLQKRAALKNRAEKDKAILRELLALPAYQGSRRVLLYVSTSEEADTRRLLNAALRSGKAVYAPHCPRGGESMAFYLVRSEAELKPGRFGILEPDPERCLLLEQGPGMNFEDALCVVPGLAFDRGGRRLGYGKGYYDRFLAEHEILSAGLCYRELVLPVVPAEEHDQKVRLLVTEEGCTACR